MTEQGICDIAWQSLSKLRKYVSRNRVSWSRSRPAESLEVNRSVSLRKPLLVSFGLLCVGLGAAGVILPLVPTTPFLLLAAACFAKSSDRFYMWLLEHRRFGPMIRDYREKRGITRKTRLTALCLLWPSVTLSAFTALSSWVLRGMLFAVALGVTWHLLSLKTLPRS